MMKLAWLFFMSAIPATLNLFHPRTCKKGTEYTVRCNRCWCVADGFPVCSQLKCNDVQRKYWNSAKQNHFYTPQGHYYIHIGQHARAQPTFKIKSDNVINDFFRGLKNITAFRHLRGQKPMKFVARPPPSMYHKVKHKTKTGAHHRFRYNGSRKKMIKG